MSHFEDRMRDAAHALPPSDFGSHRAIQAAARAAEDAGREAIAKWMTDRGYATGHGDSIEDLLSELVGQCRPGSKRPVAFRVSNGRGGFVVTQDEREAADIAEAAGVDYQGLFVRGERS